MSAPKLCYRPVDSNLLISYLGALTFQFDNELKSNNEDPDKLRDHWFTTYPKCAEHLYRMFSVKDDTINDTQEGMIELIDKVKIDKDMFMECNTGKNIQQQQYSTTDIYLWIWFNSVDSTFYSTEVEKCMYNTGYNSDPENGPVGYINADLYHSSYSEIKTVDFVELLCDYKGLVKVVCEQWSYRQVIKHIKMHG